MCSNLETRHEPSNKTVEIEVGLVPELTDSGWERDGKNRACETDSLFLFKGSPRSQGTKFDWFGGNLLSSLVFKIACLESKQHWIFGIRKRQGSSTAPLASLATIILGAFGFTLRSRNRTITIPYIFNFTTYIFSRQRSLTTSSLTGISPFQCHMQLHRTWREHRCIAGSLRHDFHHSTVWDEMQQ